MTGDPSPSSSENLLPPTTWLQEVSSTKARMLLKTGLPTSLLTGTVVLLVLTSHVFRGPNNSVSKRNGPNEVVSFNASASKLAVYFGSKTSVHDSLLNVHLVNRSPSKRDEWYVSSIVPSHDSTSGPMTLGATR